MSANSNATVVAQLFVLNFHAYLSAQFMFNFVKFLLQQTQANWTVPTEIGLVVSELLLFNSLSAPPPDWALATN